MPSDRLTEADIKFWHPRKEVLEYVQSKIPRHGKVLEVGSGRIPFERADIFVDMTASPNVPKELMIECNITKEPLPFADKSFDFVYCRHTLEDLHSPFFVLTEMSRVGKAGYIETPSPIAEMCRGIDAGSPNWRGFNHHRWFVWNNGLGLSFVTKYPIIEHLHAPGNDELLVRILKDNPRYWNTHYLWKSSIAWCDEQDHPDLVLPEGYGALLERAVREAGIATDTFYKGLETGE